MAVFPTYVGVFQFYKPICADDYGFPHVRGGVSLIRGSYLVELLFSPRTWGCF